MASTAQLEEFFGATQSNFEQHHGFSAQRFSGSLGPLPVELCWSSELAAQDWGRSLHLRPALTCPGTAPPQSARILVWDGPPFPVPPWGRNYIYTRRGDIHGCTDPRFQVAYNVGSGVLSMWDRRAHLGLCWIQDRKRLPDYEWVAPLRTILHWWGQDHGLQLAHSAVVGKSGRAILLAGKGGVGKSTTASACWQAGLDFVGDDYCWLDCSSRMAYCLYASARLLRDNQLSLEIRPWGQWSQEKLAYPIQATDFLAVEQIWLPRLSSGPLQLTPADARQAFAALSLTTLAQLPGAGIWASQQLQNLCQELPCFHFDLCRPPQAVADFVAEQL